MISSSTKALCLSYSSMNKATHCGFTSVDLHTNATKADIRTKAATILPLEEHNDLSLLQGAHTRAQNLEPLARKLLFRDQPST